MYGTYNKQIINEYQVSISKVREIMQECEGREADIEKGHYYRMFGELAGYMLKLINIEADMEVDYLENTQLEELRRSNNELYAPIMGEEYKVSYLNPKYAASIFGSDVGPLIAYLLARFREYIQFAYRHKVYKMHEYNKWFICIFEYIKQNKVQYKELKDIIVQGEFKNIERDFEVQLREDNDPDFSIFNNIILKADLKDLRYLYRYGTYISENELELARLLMEYDEKKLDSLAKTVVNAFLLGFKTHGKRPGNRDCVRIVHVIGLERLTRCIFTHLECNKLKPIIVKTTSTDACREFYYDHRYDDGVFINEEYLTKCSEYYLSATEKVQAILKQYIGHITMLQFGQKLNSLSKKQESIEYSKEQTDLIKGYRIKIRKINEKYAPRIETSYTGIAFPHPEIGSRFREIFDDIYKINMMDNDEYGKLQQLIIDSLDQADYIRVKGKGSNLTDIKVKIWELSNPEKETAFSNCEADVNIPLGEVYTSPVLLGTEGILHVSEVLVQDTKYYDLVLKFKNGYVDDYSCRNYPDEAANRKLLEENLLGFNRTLPMGEFAIGVNTLAYMISRKYGIVEELHTLIVEKMGPHFAIGDTCFSWEEDNESYNIYNNKKMVAKENEKTANRRTNILEAYTNIHTDLTLPYDAIEEITVVSKDGSCVDIIRDGRFVLRGTEKLNVPFDMEEFKGIAQ